MLLLLEPASSAGGPKAVGDGLPATETAAAPGTCSCADGGGGRTIHYEIRHSLRTQYPRPRPFPTVTANALHRCWPARSTPPNPSQPPKIKPKAYCSKSNRGSTIQPLTSKDGGQGLFCVSCRRGGALCRHSSVRAARSGTATGGSGWSQGGPVAGSSRAGAAGRADRPRGARWRGRD